MSKKYTITKTIELPDDFMNPTKGFTHNCFYCPFQQWVDEINGFICLEAGCPFDNEDGWKYKEIK